MLTKIFSKSHNYKIYKCSLFYFSMVIFTTLLHCGCEKDIEKEYALLVQKGEIFFLNNENIKALNSWKKALNIKKSDYQLIRKIGEIHLKLADPKSAIEMFELALNIKPSEWDILIELVKIKLIFGDIDGAQNDLHKLEIALPKNPSVKILQGDFAISKDKLEEAKNAYLNALNISPSLELGLIKTALCYLSLDQKENAETYYNKIDIKGKITSDILLLMGDYWDYLYDFEKAEQFYVRAVENSPEDLSLVKHVAGFYSKLNNFAEAESLLSKALNKMPHNLSLKEALLECLISQNKINSAKVILNELENLETNSYEVNFLRGKFYLISGEPVKAANYFKLIIDKSPDLPIIQYFLGISYLASGQTHQARQTFIQALIVEPNFTDAELALAGLHYKNEEYILSMEYARRVLKSEPNNFNALMILGNIFLAQNDYNEASNNFINARSVNPESLEALYFIAMTKEFDGNINDALKLYADLLCKNSNLINVSERYIKLLMKQGKINYAIKTLEENIKKDPKNGYNYILLGNCYLKINNILKAKESFEKAILIIPYVPSPYIKLSKIYYKLGLKNQQIKTLENCINNSFDYAIVYKELSLAYQNNNEIKKAIKALETGVIRNPNAIILNNDLAWMYLEHNGDLNKAFEFAQKAYEYSSNDPIIADTLAWAYYKKGIYSMAQILLEESIKLKDDYPIVHYHLGMVLTARGDLEGARKSFGQAMALGLAEPYLKDAKEHLGRL